MDIKSELRAIDQLINDLLDQKTALAAKLALLEPPLDAALDPPQSSTPWVPVVNGKKKLSLPLFDSSYPGPGETPLSNFFSPLALLESPSAPISAVGTAHVKPRRRKRISPNSDTAQTPSPARKRARESLLPPAIPPTPFGMRSPVNLPASGRAGPSVDANEVKPQSVVQLTSASNAVTSTEPETRGENSDIIKHPPIKYIILGDSVIRNVALPNSITYSYSGATIQDLVMHIPVIVDEHPSAHSIIVHVGINDIRRIRQSVKLQEDFELLSTTVESLGKICILSGILPPAGHGSELFSRIYSANVWLENFCLACGYSFINHFDTFWNKDNLYRDKIHLNKKGLDALGSNILNQVKEQQT